MTPAIADRLAKLLRLACSTGPDGEKLAAHKGTTLVNWSIEPWGAR